MPSGGETMNDYHATTNTFMGAKNDMNSTQYEMNAHHNNTGAIKSGDINL